MSEVTQMALPHIPPSPRPKKLDKETTREIAQKLAEEVLKYDSDYGTLDEITNDIFGVIDKLSIDTDGYRIARILEDRYYWTCDSTIVEIMDAYSTHQHDALRKTQHAWVKEHNIQPPLPNGTWITWRNGSMKTGIIDRVCDHSPACYLIKEYGAVSETRRLIVPFEDVQKIDAPTSS